ncbi:unnamed protein product [Camellia sinensis]
MCFASLACPDPDPDPGSSNAPRNQHPSGDQRPLPLSPTTYQSITNRFPSLSLLANNHLFISDSTSLRGSRFESLSVYLV